MKRIKECYACNGNFLERFEFCKKNKQTNTDRRTTHTHTRKILLKNSNSQTFNHWNVIIAGSIVELINRCRINWESVAHLRWVSADCIASNSWFRFLASFQTAIHSNSTSIDINLIFWKHNQQPNFNDDWIKCLPEPVI